IRDRNVTGVQTCALPISLVIQARDRGMAQILSGRHTQPQRYDWSRDRLAPLVNRVADRAREAGLLREDVVGTDLIFLQVALTGRSEERRVGEGCDVWVWG